MTTEQGLCLGIQNINVRSGIESKWEINYYIKLDSGRVSSFLGRFMIVDVDVTNSTFTSSTEHEVAKRHALLVVGDQICVGIDPPRDGVLLISSFTWPT